MVPPHAAPNTVPDSSAMQHRTRYRNNLKTEIASRIVIFEDSHLCQ